MVIFDTHSNDCMWAHLILGPDYPLHSPLEVLGAFPYITKAMWDLAALPSRRTFIITSLRAPHAIAVRTVRRICMTLGITAALPISASAEQA